MKDKNNLKDEELMIFVKQYDDREAFEIILNRYKTKILNFILRIVNNFHIAEELSQDVFVSIYINRKKYQNNGKFSSFIFKIATNKAFNYLKKGKEVPMDDKNFIQFKNELKTPLEEAIMDEKRKLFEKKLMELSPVERTALILYIKEDKSYQEIAEMLGCSLQSVKNYIHRGKIKLIKSTGKLIEKSSGEDKNV